MKTVSPRRWWPFAALLAVAALLCFGVPALVAGQMTGTLANARSLQTAITMMAVDTKILENRRGDCRPILASRRHANICDD